MVLGWLVLDVILNKEQVALGLAVLLHVRLGSVNHLLRTNGVIVAVVANDAGAERYEEAVGLEEL